MFTASSYFQVCGNVFFEVQSCNGFCGFNESEELFALGSDSSHPSVAGAATRTAELLFAHWLHEAQQCHLSVDDL